MLKVNSIERMNFDHKFQDTIAIAFPVFIANVASNFILYFYMLVASNFSGTFSTLKKQLVLIVFEASLF